MREHDPKRDKPRNLAIAGRTLAIAWGDGHESYFPFDDLRRACPCATCRARRSTEATAGPLRVLDAPKVGAVTIRALQPVGAYAVQVVWSDGHDTGIWAFEWLRGHCPCEACRRGD